MTLPMACLLCGAIRAEDELEDGYCEDCLQLALLRGPA